MLCYCFKATVGLRVLFEDVSFVHEVKLHAPLSFLRSLLSRCSVWWWFSLFSFCSKLVLQLQQHWDFVELLFSAASSTFSVPLRSVAWRQPADSAGTFHWSLVCASHFKLVRICWNADAGGPGEVGSLVSSHCFIDLGLETWAQCVSGPRIEAC